MTDEFEDLVPPPVVKLSGGLLVAAGLFGAAAAVQVLALFDGVLPTLSTLPLCGAALSALLVAPYAYDGRGWAAITGAVLAALVAATSLAWTLYALASFVLAPAVLLAFAASFGAVAVLPFAIAPSLRVTAARKALEV